MKAREYLDQTWTSRPKFCVEIKEGDKWCKVEAGRDNFGNLIVRTEGEAQLAEKYAGNEGFRYYLKRYSDNFKKR